MKLARLCITLLPLLAASANAADTPSKGLPVADAVAAASGNASAPAQESIASSSTVTPDGPVTDAKVAAASVRTIYLPMDGMAVVQAKSGKTYMVSTNGRYQFDGKIKDIYTNKEINTVEDAIESHYLTLAQMSLSQADIATIAFGNPQLPLQGRLLIDPYCDECKRVLNELEKMKDKVHLEVMIAPVSSKEAIKTGLGMWCAYEKNYNLGRQILGDLMKGPPYPDYPVNEACKGQRVMLNTMLIRTLGLEGVPAFWRADGFAKAGVPKDMLGFLNSRRGKELAAKEGK